MQGPVSKLSLAFQYVFPCFVKQTCVLAAEVGKFDQGK